MGVLEYLPRYERALAEISRVLAPGGVAVLAVPNRASAYHIARTGYLALRSQPNASRIRSNYCRAWRKPGSGLLRARSNFKCSASNSSRGKKKRTMFD